MSTVPDPMSVHWPEMIDNQGKKHAHRTRTGSRGSGPAGLTAIIRGSPQTVEQAAGEAAGRGALLVKADTPEGHGSTKERNSARHSCAGLDDVLRGAGRR